ncbi:DUF739 family protein [Clostridiaceae bacterium HFYG-1003]|nr:DUF739 family protein [Clostridiaceae bacterium HFYG-1003]
MSVVFDFSKLKGLIREHCGSQAVFAEKIGISATSLYDRLGNRVPFDTVEIDRAMKLFGLPDTAINEIFFVKKYGKP